MARPKRRINRSTRVDKFPDVARPDAEEIQAPSGPAFAVALKENHFCFAGGSKFLRIPRRFVEAQLGQYGDRFGPNYDWVELRAVDDPSIKFKVDLVRNERKGTLQIGEGFEKFASQYALQPGNRLRFILVAASQFSVDMCNKMVDHESEDDQTDESEEEAGGDETVERKERQPRITDSEELAQRERDVAQILLQQRDHKRPLGHQKLKRALEMAIRKRHGRSMSKTKSEIGGGSRDKGGPVGK